MKKRKSFLQFLPELGLLGVVLFYWNNTFFWNPVAWGLMVLLVLQLAMRRTIPGIAIGGVFVFLSLWMVLAFLSDLVKEPTPGKDPTRFILMGVSLCGMLTACSMFMLAKYVRKLKDRGAEPEGEQCKI